VNEQRSEDGTVKCLFRFDDGAEIESVFMKYGYGNSICISSQCGCRMGCSFCASTMDGLERSLTGGEMLAQVLAMKKLTGEDIGHVVIMGMGEPFDNYDNVIRFIRLINDRDGFDLGLRNITVSTCGIIPGIKKFAEDAPQVNLAVSLHAPNQGMRERTMPVAKKYGYDELMEACREYTEKTGRRITFEYALIDGVNDTRECAVELAGRLMGWLAHVNLIPLNEVSGREYKKTQPEKVRRFMETLERRGVAVTVRRTLGSDIDAACGQLRRNRD
jgi:23S rRNA (adenine2503-C2)-methyltransferase